jgi:hypothetical protein
MTHLYSLRLFILRFFFLAFFLSFFLLLFFEIQKVFRFLLFKIEKIWKKTAISFQKSSSKLTIMTREETKRRRDYKSFVRLNRLHTFFLDMTLFIHDWAFFGWTWSRIEDFELSFSYIYRQKKLFYWEKSLFLPHSLIDPCRRILKISLMNTSIVLFDWTKPLCLELRVC